MFVQINTYLTLFHYDRKLINRQKHIQTQELIALVSFQLNYFVCNVCSCVLDSQCNSRITHAFGLLLSSYLFLSLWAHVCLLFFFHFYTIFTICFVYISHLQVIRLSMTHSHSGDVINIILVWATHFYYSLASPLYVWVVL